MLAHIKGVCVIIDPFKLIWLLLSLVTLHLHVLLQWRRTFYHIKSWVLSGTFSAFWVSICNNLVLSNTVVFQISLTTLEPGSRGFPTTSEWLLLCYRCLLFWRCLLQEIPVNRAWLNTSI